MMRRLTAAAVAVLMVSAAAPAAAAEPLPLRTAARNAASSPSPVAVTGAGWGHSVGLSQYGAYSMARDGGRTASQILSHYYPGTKISKVAMPGAFTVGLFYQATDVPVEAVGGSVRWTECQGGSCEAGIEQPQGTTWRVTFSGGVMRLLTHDGRTDTAAAGADYRALHDGTVVKAPNPIVDGPKPGDMGEGAYGLSATTRYKRGDLRFRVNFEGDGVLVASEQDSIEDYIYGLAEMPLSWGVKGLEALKAQAIIGRTYAYRQLLNGHVGGSDWKGCDCQIRATPANQAWTAFEVEGNSSYGSYWVQAVDGTRASDGTPNALLYDGSPAWTFYSSSHGGATEDVQDSWAYGATTESFPYLVSVEDPWSLVADNPYRSWDRVLGNGSMATLVGNGLKTVTRLRVLTRTSGGTPETLEVQGVTSAGETRTVVWPSTVPDPAGARMRTWYGGSVLPSQQMSRMGFGPFHDDDGNTHEFAIAFAERAGITNGRTPTTFEPWANLTRGEMAAFLYRMFDIPKASKRYFSDVSSSHTHAEAIDAVAAAGISLGYPDGTYRPGRTLTRAEMATFLARALDLAGVDPRTYFSDVSNSGHGPNIGAIAKAGISLGYGDGTYRPKAAVSRGEMVTFLLRSAQSY